jgi:hypothetical protein
MTDKPDPAKDAGRTDSSAAKRPHATLDLKATEVKSPSSTPSQQPSAASSTSSASSASASGGTPAAAAASASSPSSTPGSSASGSAPAGGLGATSAAKPASPAGSPGSTSAASTKQPAAAPGAKDGAPKATPPESAAAKPVKSGGGFFSHLAAGLIGGGLVYAGSAYLDPAWLPRAATGQPQLSERVAALEAAAKINGDTASLDAKLSQAESRLAKLDQLEQNLAALTSAQSTLQAETKSLSEAAQRGDGAASAQRLSKLEEQLSIIASSAPASDGRVPQVAALAGKISDLETSLAGQIAALRKSVPTEVDERIATTQEASEAAKSATTRLDRELSQIRTDQARGSQKIEAAKADTDRLSAAVDAIKEETGKLSSAFGELRGSVEQQLKSAAKPQDVAAAVAPVATKLTEIEKSVQSVVKSEEDRKQNAERIVLSLELSNLKRALDRGQGQGYAAELAEVQKASGGQLELGALERFKDTGVATLTELKAGFRPVMNAAIDADQEPPDGSVLDRLLSGAKSVVRVRKINHDAEDTSAEAVVARIETALNDGRLGDVITLAKTLPQRAQAPLDDWLIKVTARNSVDQAIAKVEDRLKASLSGAAESAPAVPAPVQN